MSTDVFSWVNKSITALVICLIPLQFIPLFIWLERKGAAVIQDRPGPNRASILGLRLFGMFHNIADVIKLMTKEDIVPRHVEKFYYLLAPAWAMAVAFFPLLLMPLAAPQEIAGRLVVFQALDFEVGLLFSMAASGLGIYSLILAGWASHNKYSMLGGLRSSAQMISYELTLGLAAVAVLLTFGTAQFSRIVEAQGGLLQLFGREWPLPAWGVFLQPIGFLLFLVSGFAETNRSPFDLAEGESEIVAGYHTEYSSMKFGLFFMAEYSHMTAVAFLTATLFFGGYQVPFVSGEWLAEHPVETARAAALSTAAAGVLGAVFFFFKGRHLARVWKDTVGRLEMFLLAGLCAFLAVAAGAAFFTLPAWSLPDWFGGVQAALIQIVTLVLKALFFCWLYVWVRWTLPRFRYDQLMHFGWKLLLPLALLNLFATAWWRVG